MAILHRANQNRLLAALPAQDFDRVAAQLKLVELAPGAVLHDPGEKLQHAHFPTTAIVSLQYFLPSGESAETAGVGNEGMVGTSMYMGGSIAESSAVTQAAGFAYRLERGALQREFNRAGCLQRHLLRYAHGLLAQTLQTAACDRRHTIEQRMCRWLLLRLDRTGSNELLMTQELVAGMLGVRREGVTEIAGDLQRAGFISYHRGHITVLDRAGLQSRSCDCYAAIREELDRLLADLRPRPGMSTLGQLLSPDPVVPPLAGRCKPVRFRWHGGRQDETGHDCPTGQAKRGTGNRIAVPLPAAFPAPKQSCRGR